MKPADLILRCYAEKVGDQWQAFCLDLSLAAQGDTAAEVEQKLLSMIREYVYDALVGKDKAHAKMLLKRRAPFQYWLKFYAFVACYKIGLLRHGLKHLFFPPMPLTPANYTHV